MLTHHRGSDSAAIHMFMQTKVLKGGFGYPKERKSRKSQSKLCTGLFAKGLEVVMFTFFPGDEKG